MQKRIISNNRIRANKVRLIGPEGEQLGVVSLQEALQKAYAMNLDLIQVTEKVEPPVCKITNYGKYAYQTEKKERKIKHHKSGEMKNIRLTFAISPHDLETRASSAAKFLKKGCKVRIEMRLRGRENGMRNFSEDKIKSFLEAVGKIEPIKIEKNLTKEPRGLSMIIAKQ